MRTEALCVAALLIAGPAFADAVVSQKSRAFRPGDVTINRGEKVTFTNDDSYIHQVYVDGLFDSDEKAPGESLNEIFPKAGSFPVRCHIHPTMRMTVHVK